MHHESRRRVSVGICEGNTHDKEAGKATPASDVIALYCRPRYLRGSTRYVSTCGLITEAALCQLQGVPLEVTCRGEVAYSSEDGNVAPAREVILL